MKTSPAIRRTPTPPELPKWEAKPITLNLLDLQAFLDYNHLRVTRVSISASGKLNAEVQPA